MVFGIIMNCLCGFGMDVVIMVVCVIKFGEVDLIIVGGVESMSCVLFVMLKVIVVFSCVNEVYDIIIGW